MELFSYLNEQSSLKDIVIRDMTRYQHFMALTENVMRGESELSISERELIAAFVSGLNDCSYCYNSHKLVATQFGVDDSLLESLLTDIDNSGTNNKLKSIFHFVKKLTQSPSKIINDDAQKVFNNGWSEQALSDAIAVCSLFNFANRIIDGHGIKGNKTIYEIGAKLMVENGYSLKQ